MGPREADPRDAAWYARTPPPPALPLLSRGHSPSAGNAKSTTSAAEHLPRADGKSPVKLPVSERR